MKRFGNYRFYKITFSKPINEKLSNITLMSTEEFYARIDEAEEDIIKGNIITHSDLLDKIKNW
jgi:hypothetical protein